MYSKLYSQFHRGLKTFKTTQFQNPTLNAGRVSVTAAIRKTAMFISFGMDPNNVELTPRFAKTTAYTCSCVVIARKFRNEPDKSTLLTSGLVQVFRAVIRRFIYIYVHCRRDFGFSPWCKWNPHPSRVKQSEKWTASAFKTGPIGRPDTLVTTNLSCVTFQKSEYFKITTECRESTYCEMSASTKTECYIAKILVQL